MISSWFPPDGVVGIEEYPDRILALDAETIAIRGEHPVHNLQHNGETVRLRQRAEVEIECKRMSRRWRQGLWAYCLLTR